MAATVVKYEGSMPQNRAFARAGNAEKVANRDISKMAPDELKALIRSETIIARMAIFKTDDSSDQRTLDWRIEQSGITPITDPQQVIDLLTPEEQANLNTMRLLFEIVRADDEGCFDNFHKVING